MDDIFQGPAEVFRIFGFPITESIVNSWIVMAVLIVLALVLRRNLKTYPGRVQNVLELIVDGFNSLVSTTMGPNRIGFMPYMITLFLFIAFSNMLGLFGLRPPTADINISLGLALLTFLAIHLYGFRIKGFRYILSFTEPFFPVLPLNIIGELAKPVSLSFRLFGNILGGAVLMAMIGGAIAIFVPVFPGLYFELFAGLLQSFIFVMLTMVFITLAIE